MQQKQLQLSAENLQQAKDTRKEMLKIAQNCYKKAKECDVDGEGGEEEWLQHYMLGKVAEKMRRPPQEYLQHYRQVSII